MTAEDFIIQYGGDREAVEAIRERLPELDWKATLALVVEPVNPINRSTFMISSEQKEFSGYLIL